jgi:hypothetical protein
MSCYHEQINGIMEAVGSSQKEQVVKIKCIHRFSTSPFPSLPPLDNATKRPSQDVGSSTLILDTYPQPPELEEINFFFFTKLHRM